MATKKKTGAQPRSGTGKTRSKSASAAAPEYQYGRIIGAVVCLFLGIFILIGCFETEDGGWAVIFLCDILRGLLGWGCYILPPCLLASAWMLGVQRRKPARMRVISALLLPVAGGALLQLMLAEKTPGTVAGLGKFFSDMYASGKALESGGALAGSIGVGLESAFSAFGAIIILLFVLILLFGLAFHAALGSAAQFVRRRQRAGFEARQRRIKERREMEAAGFAEDDDDDGPVPVPVPPPAPEPAQPAPAPDRTGGGKRRRAIDIPVDDTEAKDVLAGETEENATAGVEPLSVQDAAKIAGVPVVETAAVSSESVREEKKKTAAAVAAETENMTRMIEEKSAEEPGKYSFPPVSLLRSSPAAAVDGREEMALNRERLSTTLRSFGVNAAVTDMTRGPTVTRYDLELEAGVKLSKITNLAGDLALSLGVTGVRIAPIPDKISTVGIEVPNKIVSTVYLRELIDSPAFRNAQSRLSFCIGKDISGSCIVGNIAKLPHLLIAGTTGSGKSVCMNSLIISLLYKATPEEVRLIMIDPKMVELGIYNGIPHLYVPVVTDPKKAAGALQWAVVEMLKRYRLFSEAGVRDIAAYNAHQRKTGGATLPQVVTVIDELADLMLVASKEVEESICRVAQMGRASGMHLVIATQRPSADVITGLMKANIPSRIAFAVSSAMESRIILDAQGAEKLIGMGDMLYAPLGVGKPVRIQGAFVSDEEREDIINYIKSGSEAQYSDEILEQIEKAAEDKPAKGETARAADDRAADYDELLPQAVEVIFDTKQASVSMLQRRLKLGYSRAARLVDQMEEMGIVGPFEGSKPRQIMITREQWQEMQMNGSAPMDAYQEKLELPESDGEDE